MGSGQKIGYKRVSTADQNTARQLADIEDLDEVFEDKASGRDTKRPQFEAMMKHVRKGDTVFVHSMDRLARKLSDLEETVRKLNDKGVGIRFIKENLDFQPGNANPMSTLLLHLLGAVAQFELSLIKERRKEGVEAARLANKYKGGNNKLKADRADQIRQMSNEGRTAAEIANALNISRQTVYTYTPEVKRDEFRGGSNKKDPETVEAIKRRLAAGDSPSLIAKDLGVSRQTVYTYGGATKPAKKTRAKSKA